MGIIICDIDGVLADVEHRLHYIRESDGSMRLDANWDGFFEACDGDAPIPAGIALLESLLGGEHTICLLSGRSRSVDRKTVEWLESHVKLPSDRGRAYGMWLRGAGDHRPDYVFKGDVIQQLHAHEDGPVLLVIDDSLSIINATLALGIPALHFRRPNTSVDASRQ